MNDIIKFPKILWILSPVHTLYREYSTASTMNSIITPAFLSSIRRTRFQRRMREALVKASAVGGLPKTINALMAMKAVTPSHLLDDPGDVSPTTRRHDVEKGSAEILDRGGKFWDRIYGKISRRIMSQMERCGTEDLAVTARLMYGHILSNTQILSAPETSFVLIAGLIPQDVNPQLKGHLRGALNAGASKEEVTAVRDLVIRICEAAGMQRLDASAPGGWGWGGEIADV
ncbi:hypothetical protein HYQ44_015536 [Verticillium longisporum]|nr:hypothetical protein HYQ44_015536 [Verticillium longisporum]